MDEPGETDDLFRVEDVRQTLAPVAEIVLPPEEIRRQKVRRVVLSVTAFSLALATAWTVHYLVHAAAVEATALAAGDSGRADQVEDAMDTLGSREAPGLRARFEAMRAFAGITPIEQARAALDAVPADDAAEASERWKAETYVALTAGEVNAALAASSRLIARGTFAAETAHARSLAALAVGDPDVALVEARAAVGLRGGAPRYAAQVALASACAGDVDGGLAALAGARGPAVDLARARVLALARRPGASEAADAVLAAEESTPAERAWAELVRADEAAQSGRRELARERLSAALAVPPPGDATFRWTAAKVHLVLGDDAGARAMIENVRAPSAEPGLAGRIRAWLLLETGDSTGALRELASVPASPAAFMLVARAHEARAAWDEARAVYDRAAEHPGWAAEALMGRAALELSQGEAAEAATFARRALEVDAAHPERVRTATRALVAAGDAPSALPVVEAALAAHAGDDRLLEAKGDVLFALERWGEARSALRAAAEVRPDEAPLQARRGEAARRAGERDEARAALELALAAEPTHPRALAQRFLLAVEEHDLDRASGLREALVAEDVPLDGELHLALTRFHVGYGSGLSGTRDVMRAMQARELRGAPELRLALAELYLHAERWRPAIGMFEQARRLGADPVQVAIGKALASVLDGRGNVATQALNDALEASMPAAAAEGTGPTAAGDPRLLLTRGRLEMNLGRLPSARRFAERAIAARDGYTEAYLLLAELEQRSRRDPGPALRSATRYPGAQPVAFALLAGQLGATSEGCALAARYLAAVGRNGAHVDAMVSLRERCGE